MVDASPLGGGPASLALGQAHPLQNFVLSHPAPYSMEQGDTLLQGDLCPSKDTVPAGYSPPRAAPLSLLVQPRRVGGASEEEALAHSWRTRVKSLGFVMYQLRDLKVKSLSSSKTLCSAQNDWERGR